MTFDLCFVMVIKCLIGCIEKSLLSYIQAPMLIPVREKSHRTRGIVTAESMVDTANISEARTLSPPKRWANIVVITAEGQDAAMRTIVKIL